MNIQKILYLLISLFLFLGIFVNEILKMYEVDITLAFLIRGVMFGISLGIYISVLLVGKYDTVHNSVDKFPV